jgi:hypothetical protein
VIDAAHLIASPPGAFAAIQASRANCGHSPRAVRILLKADSPAQGKLYFKAAQRSNQKALPSI